MRIAEDELRLFWLPLAGPEAQAEALLDDAERRRAARFLAADARRRYVHARAGLRVLLGRCLDRPPASVRLAVTAAGKPYLPGAEICFNLSHAHERALYGLARRRVGVDIEHLGRHLDPARLAQRYLAPAERDAVLDRPPSARAEAFLLHWTRKEAFLKATGEGLRRRLRELDLSAGGAELHTLLLPGDGRWSLASLRLDDYVASAAVEGAVAGLRLEPLSLDEAWTRPSAP